MCKKNAKVEFIVASTPTTVDEVGDHFHQEFQASLRANPHKYRGVNLGYTTWIQQHARL